MGFTIGIIGANGQVGTELCLVLAGLRNVKVVPICRNELGGAFLEYCGLECRYGTTADRALARKVLNGVDVVVDLSLVLGDLPTLRQRTREVIRNELTESGDVPFIYGSTIMAFGMRGPGTPFQQYRVAHTIYGAAKRYAERLVVKWGRRLRKRVYVFRLGEVNGEMQECTRVRVRELARRMPEVLWIPAGDAYCVFPSTIAEAIMAVAKGAEDPGIYTLVCSPQWSWAELAQYYCERAGVQPELRVSSSERAPLRAPGLRLFQGAAWLAERYRNEIGYYVLSRFPQFEARVRHLRSVLRAREGLNLLHHRVFDIFPGSVPGRRLRTLHENNELLIQRLREVREILHRAGGMAEHVP
jgi:dTDP-4-dehydrorhamnose reductase